MMTRRIGAAIGIATLLASGGYVFLYLVRWEWNRAQISALIFLATEVAFLTWLVNDRIRRLQTDIVALRRDRTLAHVRDGAPPPRRHFAWLERTDRLHVFVPILLGAGVVLSAVAWVVERLAIRTARPLLEHDLTDRLAGLAPPATLLPPDPSDWLRRPGRLP